MDQLAFRTVESARLHPTANVQMAPVRGRERAGEPYSEEWLSQVCPETSIAYFSLKCLCVGCDRDCSLVNTSSW